MSVEQEELIKQIQEWSEEKEYHKIAATIEMLPEEDRMPELTSLLADACEHLAESADAPEAASYLKQAFTLLDSVEEELKEDGDWNYRMGYACYHLGREGEALPCFEKSVELRPGDEDAKSYVEKCKRALMNPTHITSFRRRTKAAWKSFLNREAELRRMISLQVPGDKIIEKCSEMLAPAFSDVAFELGRNGEKYDLILSPEGNRAKLFQLLYFRQQAPETVLEHWNILLGRQHTDPEQCAFEMYGQSISAQDVRVWPARKESVISVALYCETLLPLLREDADKAWWMLAVMLDQVLGEVASMRYVEGFEVLNAPLDEAGLTLDQLPAYLKTELAPEEENLNDAEHYCTLCAGYEMQPDQGESAGVRTDIYAGVTACAQLLNDFYQGEEQLMNRFHADGVVPGFLEYPLDGFSGEDRGEQVLNFRDTLEKAILEKAGAEAVTFIGGASGVYDGYLDFIAWDLEAVLNAAVEVLEEMPVRWTGFHVFRRGIEGMLLKDVTENQ